ncbi:hypothetical protein SHIRM173S_07821 [Streptomyces hirsutus]
MPGTNLTREEAQQRAKLLTVDSYEIDLDLSGAQEGGTYRSVTTVRFDVSADADGAESFIDLVAPTVHEVTLNGDALDPAEVFEDSRIALPGLLPGRNVLRVSADCAYTNTGEGLHRFVDPVDDQAYLYTQFEVPDARRVFASFEQPDLKATFRFTVKAPHGWTVISNSPTPEPRDNVWEFEPTPRISTYITALIVGPYHSVHSVYEKDGQSVPLGIYCRPSLAEFLDADAIFDVTRQGFEWFQEKFDYAYPFGKYELSGVQAYFKRHAYGNTRLSDLLGALEETSGRDLSTWSKKWLETAGINVLRPEIETDGADGTGTITSFAIRQEAPALPTGAKGESTLRPHRIAVGLYDLDEASGKLVRVDRVELDVDGELTAVPQLVGKARPAVVLLNDDDLSYAKVRLDERSLAFVTEHLGDFEASLPRALCWASAWDMTRDAELATRDYLSLVLSGIGKESDIGVVQSLHRQVKLAIDLYSAPNTREALLTRWTEATLAHLRAAEAGSDHQLGVGPRLRRDGEDAGAAGPPGQPAGGHADDRGPGRRHGAALDVRGAAGGGGPVRRDRDRGRVRARQDRRGRASRGDRAGRPADRGGQGGGVGVGRGVRQAAERAPGSGHRRLRPDRPARAAGSVHGPVLRGGGRRVGVPLARDGPADRGRPLPGDPGLRGDPGEDGRLAGLRRAERGPAPPRLGVPRRRGTRPAGTDGGHGGRGGVARRRVHIRGARCRHRIGRPWRSCRSCRRQRKQREDDA